MKYKFIIKVIILSIPLLILLFAGILVLIAPKFGYLVNFPVSDEINYLSFYLVIYLIVVLIGSYLIFKNLEFKTKPLKYVLTSITIVFFIVLYGFIVVNQITPLKYSDGTIWLKKDYYSCDLFKPIYKEIIFYYDQTYKFEPTSTLPC